MTASDVALFCLCSALFGGRWVEAAPPPAAPPPAAHSDIRDLRGSPAPSSVPPFTLTAAGALASCALLAALRAPRRTKLAEEAGEGPKMDTVGLLQEAEEEYHRGELPPDLLCLRLGEMVRSALTVAGGLAPHSLTTEEIVGDEGVRQHLAPPELVLAAELLALCDRVKFSRHQPLEGEAERALDSARKVVGALGRRHELS